MKDFNDQAAEKARKDTLNENFAWDNNCQFCTALEMVVPGLRSDSDPQIPLAQTPVEMSGTVSKTTEFCRRPPIDASCLDHTIMNEHRGGRFPREVNCWLSGTYTRGSGSLHQIKVMLGNSIFPKSGRPQGEMFCLFF